MAEFDVDAYLANLKGKVPVEREEGGSSTQTRLEIVWMNVPDNQGRVLFVPYANDGQFTAILDGVREVKLADDAGDIKWHRILPEAEYGNLNEQEKKLYSDVVSLFREVEKQGLTETGYKKYALYQGILLKHYNKKDDIIKDHTNKPAFMVFPSAKMVTAIDTDIKAKTANIGNGAWLRGLFNSEKENRQQFITISFTRGNPGYDVSVNHDWSGPHNPVIPAGFKIDDSMTNAFRNILATFLGKSAGKDKLFNEEWFTNVKKKLVILISAAKNAPVSEPAVNENKSSDNLDGVTQTPPVNVDPLKTDLPPVV